MHSQRNRNVLLIDLDGVIYQAGALIDGAVETLDWINRRGIPHLFVTNTTSRPRTALLQKFESLGFTAETGQVMTPIVAAIQWLDDHRMRKIALFVPKATRQEFDQFELVNSELETGVDAVVIGDLGQAWSFERLNQAFRLLMQSPAPQLIALGMTRYWRGRDGLQLDVAPFIKALEHAADCDAVVVGKPAAAFFEASLAQLDSPAQQALMIGDDMVGDIGAAQDCGIRGIQVRTGKFRESDLNGAIKPFAVLDSFADLPQWWERNLEMNLN